MVEAILVSRLSTSLATRLLLLALLVVEATDGVKAEGTNPDAFCKAKLKRAKDVAVLLRKEGIVVNDDEEFSSTSDIRLVLALSVDDARKQPVSRYLLEMQRVMIYLNFF